MLKKKVGRIRVKWNFKLIVFESTIQFNIEKIGKLQMF